jgi:hypothetical protein
MKNLNFAEKDIQEGDLVKLYFGDGASFVGYRWERSDQPFSFSGFHPSYQGNLYERDFQVLDLLGGKLNSKIVVGYEIIRRNFSQQRCTSKKREDERISFESYERCFGPFSSSFDIELVGEKERRELREEKEREQDED